VPSGRFSRCGGRNRDEHEPGVEVVRRLPHQGANKTRQQTQQLLNRYILPNDIVTSPHGSSQGLLSSLRDFPASLEIAHMHFHAQVSSIASTGMTFPEPQGRCEAVRPRLTASIVPGPSRLWLNIHRLSNSHLRVPICSSPGLKPRGLQNGGRDKKGLSFFRCDKRCSGRQ